ncbi:agmatinase [Metallosphaera tengchongensis]|uniref:Agmatinase n=1 Tax=Metallosphaera tengchongensis TaxID=1532350 RepID=A0A6N0NY44_9CREN|nr:agmatinase [Metallosphaera tengchongensis]QKR00298.1 agmatinase [Metallosphaera tengchongensis]
MRQIDALKSPRFAQISTYARLPMCNDEREEATFMGIPFDDATTYRPGARFGPMGIRDGSRLLRPYNPFQEVYPFEELNACDGGDVDVVPGHIEDTMSRIEEVLSKKMEKSTLFLAGGDHSVTLPILRAVNRVHGKVNLIHFDSHYDFWDSHWGKKYDHGTWLRRALEEGLLKNVIQVGIRGSLFSHEDVEDSKRLGVSSFNVRDVKLSRERVLQAIQGLQGPTYISFDIDVVDPAYAPGTGTPEVGGLTSFEALEIIRSLEVNLVGFDVVEVSPPYDVSEITSMLASNLIYEAMSLKARMNRVGKGQKAKN